MFCKLTFCGFHNSCISNKYFHVFIKKYIFFSLLAKHEFNKQKCAIQEF